MSAPRLRHFGNKLQREAHVVLDRVRAGVDVPDELVRWALLVLGDLA